MAEEQKTPTQAGEGEAAPAALTHDAVQELISRASGAQLKRLESKIEKLFAERFAALVPQAPTSDEPAADKKPDEATKANDARIRALEAKLAASEAKALESETKRQRDEERQTLAQELQAAGVTGARLKGAMAILHTEDKRVTRGADGRVVFKVQRDGFDEELDVAKGVEEWLRSAEGKEFTPPRGLSGSGAAPGQAPRNGKAPQVSKAELGAGILGLMRGQG